MSSVGIMASGVLTAAGVDVLSEPFNNFTAAPWVTAGAATIVAGRTGTAAQIVGNISNLATYTIPAPNESDTVTIGFAWRTNTSSGSQRTLFELWSDTNTVRHTRLLYNGTASQTLSVARDTTVLGTSAAVIPINTWAYVETKVTLHDTAGSAVVRVNGTDVITVPVTDTRNAGTKAVYDTLRIFTGVAGITCLWDDLYLSVGGAPFKGDTPIP